MSWSCGARPASIRSRGSKSATKALAPTRRAEPLFELVGDLVDAGFGAGLVLIAARSAGYADRTDDLLADLDRQGALRRYGVGYMHREICRVLLEAVGDLSRPESMRGSPPTLSASHNTS